ncbi:MAG: sulfotransferase family protein [Solirubrobacterales bacterium]
MSDAAPIVIGALGGSGTRVLAEALIEAGAHLGSEFNRARDNLVFTALFKRPRWFSRAGDARIHRQLDTFVRYMRGHRYSPGDYARLAGSVIDHEPTLGLGQSARRVSRAVTHRPGADAAGAPVWGWKEPNSHVFLPQLIDHFPGLRYVHVVRHGLDMAYTRNKTQLEIWGAHFGVPMPAGDEAAEANAQLDFWIATTRRAMDLGDRLGERFMLMRYDDLCREPERELRRLFDRAGLDVDAAALTRVAAGVESPDSVGRWRARGSDRFSAEQLAAVESFGFDVR